MGATNRRDERGFARLGLVATLAVSILGGAVYLSASDADAAGWPLPRDKDGKIIPRKRVIDPLTQEASDLIHKKAFGRKHSPSSLIFPDQHIPIRFSHAIHVELAECTDCHDDATKSVRASDNLLPKEATCLDCHDVEEGASGDPPSGCETCHTGFKPDWLPGADKSDTSQVKVHPPKIVIPNPNIKFNHKIHVQKGVSCETCHTNIDKVAVATRDNALPTMGTCVSCHDGKQAPEDCDTCHITNKDGRIKTDLPGGVLEPAGWYHNDAHDDQWLQNHRHAANVGDEYCSSCHTPKECVDCHNGVKKPMRVHPNNWILQHPSAARKNQPDCQSCHQSQTFCVDCHQLSKVASTTPHRPAATARFHPAGWVEFGQRGPNHHSFQAQRNIRACASCHTEESCTSCHASNGLGGLGVNPHPPGFVSSGDCDRMRDKNDRACVKCHAPGSPQLRCL